MQRWNKILLGLLGGILHYYHVKTLYENDRHFSHLSNLEREMCFRSEMGLYYSFYKRIVESDSLHLGVLKLFHDNCTEYPNTINSLSKFNIYPEVLIAGLYRMYQLSPFSFGWNQKECYTINRGEGWSSVESCVGLEVPIFFYLEVVWVFAGLTAFLLFCYGAHLSGSIFGGCVTLLSFFVNHAESTRVQWTPPLRESFAYPLIVLHCLMVTSVLHTSGCNLHKFQWKGIVISFSSCVALLFWQFSQFVLSCEVTILIAMYAIGILERRVLSTVLKFISIGFISALVGLMGNQLLLYSFLSAILSSAWVLLLCDQNVIQLTFNWQSVLRFFGIGASAIVLKFKFPNTGNDSHILKIFLSKVLRDSNDFHTLMYTCAPEFQGLPWSYGVVLTKSLLIPLLAALLILSLRQCFQAFSFLSLSKSPKPCDTSKICRFNLNHIVRTFDPPIVYNLCLLIAFFMLSMMAMRLKLFLTPQMCVLVSLIASKQVVNLIPILNKKQNMPYLFSLIILGTVCLFGYKNIQKQHDIEGEYSNHPLEELLTWIGRNTNNNDAFAGPMPITASILLSTGRPIVNHPYYEDESMRNRTIQAYSVFSRRSASDAFESVKDLRATYVVLEANKCFDHRQQRKGCRMIDLWDVHDSKNVVRPSLCPQLFSGNPSPFTRVFQNSEYAVLYLSPQDQL